jgi:vitamin B12 transporter
MKSKFLLLTAVVISSQLSAQQDSAKNLDPVVVTATKTAVKQSQTGKVVSVIDQATLRRSVGRTVPEILNNEAGMYITGANNVLGTNQDNYLRGAATGNTLILVDGVPVGDPSYINNSFDLNSINTAQIERIEILKGAQSTLWGSDAVAGVVNIITKKGGKSGIRPVLGFSYGSYRTARITAGINGELKKFSYNLNYNQTRSRGFSSAHDSTGGGNFDNDGFRQHNFQANLSYRFSPALSIQAMTNYGNYRSELDAGAFADDRDYTGLNKNLVNTVGLVYTVKNTSIHLTNTFVDARRSVDDDSGSIGGFSKFSRAMYQGRSVATELYANTRFTSHLSLVTGAQHMAQHTSQHFLSLSSFGPFESDLPGKLARITNYSVYASLLLASIHGFNAELGSRFNNHSIYGNNATYSFNPSLNINEKLRAFLNISSAFKVPSLYQLYSEYGNLDLQPEKSNNYEAGVQWLSKEKRNSIRVVGFKRDIRQLIVFYTDPVTYAGKYLNRDRQHDYGMELEASLALANEGSWVTNISWVDGRGKAEGVKVRNLYRRPNFSFNSSVNLHPLKKLTLTPAIRFIGSRLKGEYDAGPGRMPAYYTVDLYSAYQFTRPLRAFVDLRNITNQEYFDVVGYNSRRFNFMAGLQLEF